jgi:hypothetical protein
MAACGGGGGFTPADLTSESGDMSMGPDLAKSYTQTSIATLRTPQMAGTSNVELDNVVVLAIHHSSKSPKLFVQDAAGGDFSAIVISCSTSSASHPCAMSVAMQLDMAISEGHSVTIQGTYTKQSAANGAFETVYPDVVTDNGAGTLPAAKAVALTDLPFGSAAANAKWWWQRVTTTIANTDTLLPYDWSPAQFVYSGGTCSAGMKGVPYQFGFAMIPMSVTPTTPAGMMCAGTTAQPTGVATPDTHAVFFGTDFYTDGWIYSSDCRCAAANGDTLLTSTMKLSGAITGLLMYDTANKVGYQFLAPQKLTDAMIQ